MPSHTHALEPSRKSSSELPQVKTGSKDLVSGYFSCSWLAKGSAGGLYGFHLVSSVFNVIVTSYGHLLFCTGHWKTNIFLFDGALITTPINFVSLALLATSIRLRLNLPTINTITKTDVIGGKLKDIIQWSSNIRSLENSIASEADGETYTLATNILRGLNLSGFAQGLIPISNLTGDGLVNLEGALSRILNLGEEVED